MNKFNEYYNLGDDDWEPLNDTWVNSDFEDVNANSARNWKKKIVASKADIVVKMEHTFPNLSVDQLLDLISNL